jgi:hypothetical protein
MSRPHRQIRGRDPADRRSEAGKVPKEQLFVVCSKFELDEEAAFCVNATRAASPTVA